MSDYPTLRYGDQSADGWVEYLQELLVQAGKHVEKSGTFDDQTLHALREIQQLGGLSYVDGVVGDETWSYLRGDGHTQAGTDGRDAHSFVDEGTHVVTSHGDGLFLVPIADGLSFQVHPLQHGHHHDHRRPGRRHLAHRAVGRRRR